MSDRKILGVHMSVCVLNCTVPDVSFGERKKNQVVPAYIYRTFTSLYCTCFALVL